MKTSRLLIALIFALKLAAVGDDGTTVVGKFIRTTGKFALDPHGSTLSIAGTTPGKWSLEVVWQEQQLTLRDSPDVLHSSGWFVYVESPDRLWIYDGDKHLIFEGRSDHSHLVGGMTPELRATCPKEVLQALPEKAGGHQKP